MSLTDADVADLLAERVAAKRAITAACAPHAVGSGDTTQATARPDIRAVLAALDTLPDDAWLGFNRRPDGSAGDPFTVADVRADFLDNPGYDWDPSYVAAMVRNCATVRWARKGSPEPARPHLRVV